MQIKSFVAVAAFAWMVKADQELAVGKGGALDFSKSGGVAVAARGVPEANQGAYGAVSFGGAMDFSKSASKQSKRQHGPPGGSQPTDDEPWIPEWSAGSSVVMEVPESEETSAVVKGQLASTPDSHSITSSAPIASPPVASPSVPAVTSAPVAPVTSSVVSNLTLSSLNPSSSSALPKAAGTSLHGSVQTSVPVSTKTGTGPVTTSASGSSTVTSAPQISGSGTKGPLTFNIVNSMGGSITISYQLGTYSPASGGPTTVASSLIGPSASTGTFAQTTQVVAPFGWAGRMTIGKAGAPLDYRGTKIEGNNGFDGADPNADPDPDIDISYVDGYSVPASCSCRDVVLSGCNKELFDLGNPCENKVGDSEHEVCVNDPRNIHGPATPFFVPCEGAAYTFDYDDRSNSQNTCPGNTITCCIGTKCPTPARTPSANNKRELMALMSANKRADALIAA